MEENNQTEQVQVTNEQAPSIPDNAVAQETPKQKRKLSKKKKLIMLAVFLVLAGGGAAAYILTKKDPKPAEITKVEETTENSTVVEEELTEDVKKFITPTTGETWLEKPKKIEIQGYIEGETADYGSEYYEVGSRNGATIIMLVLSGIGDQIFLFEKSGSTVTYIARPDGQAVYNDTDEAYSLDQLIKSITVDKTTHYDSLSRPQKLPIGENQTASRPQFNYLGNLVRETTGDNLPKDTEIKKYGGSTFYKSEYDYVDTGLTSISYKIILPINVVSYYTYEPTNKDITKYKWSKGSSYTDDEILPITRGCGGFTSSVSRVNNLKEDELEVVGQSDTGKDIYAPKSVENTLLKKSYDEFLEFLKNGAEEQTVQIHGDKTIQQYLDEHGIIFFKDAFNDWLVYVRNDLRPQYGCAKPVVYLYPTSTTEVNVKVGANVTISDPLYDPERGWRALARPDGQLTVNGQSYTSLFWEGNGIGQYPAITSGAVVKTSEAVKTIRSQMGYMGFNNQEISDFLEYWTPYLPSKPYTRLTWLQTAEMESLAPLYISPKPDSLLRAFLDYAGLDGPIELPAQSLKRVTRSGFTATEWGGLAIHKLQQ
jgi:hypothetical protein